MNRERILIGLGVLVLIAPWSGLPLAWLEWILSVIGIAVIIAGVVFRNTNEPPSPRRVESVQVNTMDTEPQPSRTVFS